MVKWVEVTCGCNIKKSLELYFERSSKMEQLGIPAVNNSFPPFCGACNNTEKIWEPQVTLDLQAYDLEDFEF